MTKKLLIIAVVGITTFILASCVQTQHGLIEEIRFRGLILTNPTASQDKDKIFNFTQDTLKNQLYFRIEGLPYSYSYPAINKSSLIYSGYTTTIKKVLDNEILVSSIELTLDDDIYFENDTIKKDTDLWNHPLLQEYQWVRKDGGLGSALNNIDFGFTEALYDKLHIAPHLYCIVLKCKTNDGKNFEKDIYLVIRLHE
ncbi:hypothetical protein FACS1894156_0030 [Bacteroidia bacterium]|nr:hypothetical protein FACS1894156_0030 [Bacteroidia bacterium]